ncbi:MAG: ATP synthase subunit I [Pyrinomonadaceae bacterium]
MSEIINRSALEPEAATDEDASAMGRRLFRAMIWTAAVAFVISAPLLPWRVTTGLFIGGALSLLNHHWMRTAISAAFDAASGTKGRPKLKIVRFITRYFIVAAAIFAASQLDIASVVAMLVGLCSFVVAAMIEGFRQTYFVIIHREETK